MIKEYEVKLQGNIEASFAIYDLILPNCVTFPSRMEKVNYRFHPKLRFCLSSVSKRDPGALAKNLASPLIPPSCLIAHPLSI